MSDIPLKSPADYSHFVAETLNHPVVLHSTVVVWSDSPYTGTAEGEVYCAGGARPRLRKELDFYARLITSSGYEVYQGDERMFWYDAFPYPGDTVSTSIFPQHKQVPPDIKHNRIPAPGMSFERPNLCTLIQKIEEYLKRQPS